jgi:four helix bundle protein
MNRWREEMKARTHAFAVKVVGFVQTLVDRCESRRLKDQLVGAAWGVDGDWRAACCARTHKEFTSKLGTVVEEADEAERTPERDSRLEVEPGARTGSPARRVDTTPKDLQTSIDHCI